MKRCIGFWFAVSALIAMPVASRADERPPADAKLLLEIVSSLEKQGVCTDNRDFVR